MQPGQIRQNRVLHMIFHARRHGPSQFEQRRMRRLLLRARTPPNFHCAQLRLRLRHPQLNSRAPRRIVSRHHIDQRRGPIHQRDGFATQLGLSAQHRLHHEIRSVNSSKRHIFSNARPHPAKSRQTSQQSDLQQSYFRLAAIGRLKKSQSIRVLKIPSLATRAAAAKPPRKYPALPCCMRERDTSPRALLPSSNHPQGKREKSSARPAALSTGIRDQPAAPASSRNPNEAQLFAFDSCSSSIRIVGVSSTARRKRNQESSGTWRTSRGAISLKSTAINPKPPPCSNKSVARSVCSTFRQRPHNNFRNSTPAAAAECGSNASPPSINAQDSSCAVRARRAESSKLVRPEHDGPKISVSAPRGKPPVNKSISGMPLETVTTSWRSR